MTERTESRSVAVISKKKKKLELPGSCGNISSAVPSSSAKGKIFLSFFIPQRSVRGSTLACSERMNFLPSGKIYTNVKKSEDLFEIWKNLFGQIQQQGIEF